MNKTKIKILPLQSWMMSPDLFPKKVQDNYIDPILNRNGYYFQRSGMFQTSWGFWKRQNELCWFEYDNKAYRYDKDSFIFELKCLQASEYDDRNMKLISKLGPGYISKNQADMLYFWRCYNQCRNTYRRTRIECKKIFNRFKNET